MIVLSTIVVVVFAILGYLFLEMCSDIEKEAIADANARFNKFNKRKETK